MYGEDLYFTIRSILKGNDIHMAEDFGRTLFYVIDGDETVLSFKAEKLTITEHRAGRIPSPTCSVDYKDIRCVYINNVMDLHIVTKGRDVVLPLLPF